MANCCSYSHPSLSHVIHPCVTIVKYTIFPSNTIIHFYCNTATCFGSLQNHHQASSKKLFTIRNMHKKYKSKVLPVTGHEGPEGEYRYSPTLS